MDRDESFLQTLALRPADPSLRPAYFDWLTKRRDPRAEFFRLQTALAEGSLDHATRLKLCKQEQDLVARLDPFWVQWVRTYTTAPPKHDLGKLVPELVPFARTTTRLHPRRAAGTLLAEQSKIGGRFLWPADEPWPSCPECKATLAPILQLRSGDAPDVEFQAGTDLLQLFWCPDVEGHSYQIEPRAWWRDSAAVTALRSDGPDLSAFPRTSDWQGLVPFECTVHPERVLEFTLYDELYQLAGAELEGRVRQQLNDLDLGSEVFYELGECPGTKLGGKPGFEVNGRRWDHLISFATWEFDKLSLPRWLAIEDQRLIAPPGMPLTPGRLFRNDPGQVLQSPLGMQLGRTQRAHIYVCRDGEPWELRADIGD